MKPTLFIHGDLYDLEESTRLPLRLAFIGLWVWTDRDGRFEWKPRELKQGIMPYDPVDFRAVMDALETGGFVGRYVVDGKEYGVIPSWARHQRPHHTEAVSDIPAPPPELLQRLAAAALNGGFHAYRDADHGEIPVESPLATGELTVSSREGREGKGRELEGKGVKALSPDGDADPAWTCLVCGQLNSGWSPECGRCGGMETGRESPESAHGSSNGVVEVSEAAPERDRRLGGIVEGPGVALVGGRAAPLPGIPGGKRNVEAIIQRLGMVTAEIQAGTRQRLAKQQQVELLAEMTFAYWAAKHDHPRTILVKGDERERRIMKRLRENDGDVSELFYAIDGALKDDAIQGQMRGGSGKKYDGIETILRDRSQVERLANQMPKYRQGVAHKMVEKYAAVFAGDAGGDNG